MKTFLFFFLLVAFVSCSRDASEKETPVEPADAAAVMAMQQQEIALRQTSSQLATATTPEQRHHLDSVYHHQDSVYWHHHNQYSHQNTHAHNDHHHQWVHYDPTVDHSHHYHPVYPNHPHDSLIVVSNGHHPNHTVYHHNLHSLHDHHVIDSLHHIHQMHHH